MGLIRRYPALVPLLLLGPGLAWLASFYLAPNVQMFASSFWSGTLEGGFSFSLANWVNYPNALGTYQEQYLRSIQYGFAATLLCFAIAFPLAYFIAFRSGRARSIHVGDDGRQTECGIEQPKERKARQIDPAGRRPSAARQASFALVPVPHGERSYAPPGHITKLRLSASPEDAGPNSSI